MLIHVVLISFKPDAPEETKQLIFEKYQTANKDCGDAGAGILFWRVGYNLDLRKGVHLVEVAVFKDSDALQAFRTHPKHKEITDVLREVADWQVGDISDFPLQ